MVRLTDILEKVKSYNPGANLDLINKAYVYGAKAHDGQMRKSGEPYFTHPISVAGIIADMRLDVASVCAALLHDTVEDTEATHEEIKLLFGEEISFLVDGVTKLGKINFTSKEDQQAESFRKMLVAMSRDIRVLLVKLADRLDNMRTLEHMKPEARERIASETVDIYAPLAGRLGISGLKAELEDLSFKYLHPDDYVDLVKKTKKVARDREKYIDEVSHRVEKMLVERGFSIEVKGRVKHLYSLYRKMRQNHCEFEQVYDYVAFRVLVESVSDCYAALGVIHSYWTPIPGRFKDYIALPKPNNYQSLHTTVIGPGQKRIEVQFRTHEMDRIADLGIAAHWKYKESGTGSGIDAKDAARFKWLRQLVEIQQDMKDPAEFIDSVKNDLFADEVYVFTPKGDVRSFPRGSTPVDFAYAVHSEVGDHCVGARVNGAIVPLRHQLRNGDVIEIMTSPTQQPSKDWLQFVASPRARAKIRTHVRTEERVHSIKFGRDLLERELHKKDMSFNRFVKSGELDAVVKRMPNVGSSDELYALIGYGKISVAQVIEEILPKGQVTPPENLKTGIFEKTVRKVTGKDNDAGIRVADLDDVLVRYANCCNPVPGDTITGWITRGRGVTIHRRECRKAMELDPERRIDVSWSGEKIDRPVSLRVVTANRPGILARVSAEFTERGVNISEANCKTTEDGKAVNLFQFPVSDLARLRALMRSLQKIDGVYEVARV